MTKASIKIEKGCLKYKYLLNIMISILALISCIYIIFNEREYGYDNIFILPLAFSIVTVIFFKVFINSYSSIGLIIFNMIEFLRYVFIPFFMVKTQYYNSTFYANPTSYAKQITIYLMLYQLIIEYLFIYCLMKKNRVKNFYTESRCRQKNIYSKDVSKYRWILLIFSLILIMLAFVTNFSGNNYRISIFGISTLDSDNNYILGELALQCSTIILYMFLVLPNINKYSNGLNLHHKIKFLFLSLLFVGINFGDVRMIFIIKAFIVISIILKYFNKRDKMMMSCIIFLFAFCIIFIITMSDDNASHGIFYFTGTESEKNKYAYTLQKYLSGPYNIAKSIDIYNSPTIMQNISGIRVFINDIFINTFPFNLLEIDITKTTKIIFNYFLYGYYGKATQIIPLLGEGLIYFGYILSPIPSLLLLKIMMLAEGKKASVNSENSYIYFIMNFYCIYLGFMNMYNIPIIIGTLLNVLLPIHVIILVEESIRKRVRFVL